MSKKLIYLASMVNVLNLEVCKTYSIRSAGKVSLFRDFVLAVFLSVACSLLTAMPVAYGEEGYALEVNGGAVTINDDEDALRLGSYTYELWLKDLQGPTGSWRNVFCKGPGDSSAGRGPLLALRPDDPGVHFDHSTGSGQSTIDTYEGIPVNEWTHIAIVLTDLDGEQIIYQDGVQAALRDSSNLTDATQSPVLRIGLGANVVLDDFRVWNYARTQAEIQADMNRELSGVEEGLVGYWRFNEGKGTTAYDMSPYENHGTITAATWITEAAPITPGTPPVFASRPTPANGALLADTWVSLVWRPGDLAVSHDVYLGDNFDDVNEAAAETFRGNQVTTFFVVGFPGFPYPDGLVPGTTYYWRIDEVNDTDPNSPWKGDVWSFAVPPRTAYNPEPADGVKFVDPNTELSWTVGFGARLHYVYFGDNFDDVNSADMALPQADATYTPAGPLELEKIYYWRVDESDGITMQKGDVWSFKTLPIVPISDPNLVGWWKLDEGYGAITVDWSGYGNHGVISNTGGGLGESGSVWDTDPERGIVLSFNGNNSTGAYVSAGGIPAMSLTNDFTWTFWTKQHQDQGTAVPGEGNNLILGNRYSYTGANTLEFIKFTPAKFEFYNNDPDYTMTVDYDDIPSAVWIHHAGVKDGTTLTYYRNGIESGTSTITKTIEANPFYMAGEPAGGGWWRGWLSDVHIFNKALTLDEIKLVMRGDPLVAWGPNPRPGSTPYIREATPLSWSAGDNASQHDVYFGTDRGAVADADASDTTGIYRGRQGVTIYTPPNVEWGGGPYYWRIDEYNTDATISKGNVWSFTVADFILIDDFEDYDVGNNEIWWAWIDGLGYASHPTLPAHPGNGTGSMVGDETTGSYMEETIFHGGGKSMPVFYDNNQQGKFKYSEVEKTLSSRRDWTEEGVGVLTIWFRGISDNAAETLYVALNGSAVVSHDNPNAAQIDKWSQWEIDLQAFGINLANVNTMALGLGDRNNPQAGGSGTMYFDDIRLYRPAP